MVVEVMAEVAMAVEMAIMAAIFMDGSQTETTDGRASSRAITARFFQTVRPQHVIIGRNFTIFNLFLQNFQFFSDNKRSSASFQARGAAKKAKLVEKFDSCKASIKKVEAEVAKKQALVDLLELEKKNEELTAQLAALNADRAAKIEEPKK